MLITTSLYNKTGHSRRAYPAAWMLFILLFTAPLTAQNSPEQKSIRLNEVAVSKQRPIREAALTKTVIDSLQLAESTSNSLAELLAKHTSVFIKTYGLGSLATISFRGTAASHTQVEWNGMNINNPMLGQVDFSLIPVWFVDRAELYHGGSSLQEGSGALGGSINIGSSPRWDDRLYGSLMQGVGSFGNYQTFASLGGGNRKFQVRVRYQHERAENDFRFLNTAVIPQKEVHQKNAAYRKNGVVADLYWNAGKQNFFSLNGWWHQTDRNLPHIMSYEGKGREEKQQDDELRLVLKWAKYWKTGKSELFSGFTTTGVDYYLSNMTDLGKVLNYDSRSTIYSYYNKYKAEWAVMPRLTLRTVLNADYHKVKILDHITHEGYTATRSQFGASISGHYAITKQWLAYALLRVDYTDRDVAPLMPSAGLEYRPIENLVFKLNGTRNYHQPTLNDMHWLPGGNPNLKPERGYTADFTAEYSRSFGSWSALASATGYVSSIDDWIIWRPSEFRYWTAENIKKVYARGLEANVQAGYQLAEVSLALRGNYGFTRTTNQDPTLPDDGSRGKQLIYIPVNKANLMLDASWNGFYFYYMWSFTGERFTTSSNEATRHTLPAYDLHNLTLGKRLKVSVVELDIQLKVNNLFNKDYQAILWRAMPQRNYTLLIKCSF